MGLSEELVNANMGKFREIVQETVEFAYQRHLGDKALIERLCEDVFPTLASSFVSADIRTNDRYLTLKKELVEKVLAEFESNSEALTKTLAEEVRKDLLKSGFVRQEVLTHVRYHEFRTQLVDKVWSEFESGAEMPEAVTALRNEITTALMTEQATAVEDGVRSVKMLRLRVFRLRGQGFTFKEIATKLDITMLRAKELHKQAVQRRSELAAELKRYES